MGGEIKSFRRSVSERWSQHWYFREMGLRDFTVRTIRDNRDKIRKSTQTTIYLSVNTPPFTRIHAKNQSENRAVSERAIKPFVVLKQACSWSECEPCRNEILKWMVELRRTLQMSDQLWVHRVSPMGIIPAEWYLIASRAEPWEGTRWRERPWCTAAKASYPRALLALREHNGSASRSEAIHQPGVLDH